MTAKQTFKLSDSAQSRSAIIEAILSAPAGFLVTIQADTRTLSQNRQQWPILSAFAKQVQWPINGVMQFISPEDWKDILTSAYKNEMTRIAQGFEDGVVMLGLRTRKFTEKEWPEWVSFLNWAAAEKGVKVPVSKKYAEQLGFSDAE